MTISEAIKRLLHCGRNPIRNYPTHPNLYERVPYGLVYVDEGFEGQVRILGMISAFDLLYSFVHDTIIARGPHKVTLGEVLTPGRIIATWTPESFHPEYFQTMRLLAEDGHVLGDLPVEDIHWQTESDRHQAIVRKWFPGRDVHAIAQQSSKTLRDMLEQSLLLGSETEMRHANKSIVFFREHQVVATVIGILHHERAPYAVVLAQHGMHIMGVVRIHDLLARIIYEAPASLTIQPIGEWVIPAEGDTLAQKFQWAVRFMKAEHSLWVKKTELRTGSDDDAYDNRLRAVQTSEMVHATAMPFHLNVHLRSWCLLEDDLGSKLFDLLKQVDISRLVHLFPSSPPVPWYRRRQPSATYAIAAVLAASGGVILALCNPLRTHITIYGFPMDLGALRSFFSAQQRPFLGGEAKNDSGRRVFSFVGGSWQQPAHRQVRVAADAASPLFSLPPSSSSSTLMHDGSPSCPFAPLPPSQSLSLTLALSPATTTCRTSSFVWNLPHSRQKTTSLHEAVIQEGDNLMRLLSSSAIDSSSSSSSSSCSSVRSIHSILVLAGLGVSTISLASLGGRYITRVWRQRRERYDATAQDEHDRRYLFTYPVVSATTTTTTTAAVNATMVPQTTNPYTQAIGSTFTFRTEVPQAWRMMGQENAAQGNNTGEYVNNPSGGSGAALVTTLYHNIPTSYLGYQTLMDRLRGTSYGHRLYVFPPPRPLTPATGHESEEPAAAATDATVALEGDLTFNDDDNDLHDYSEGSSDVYSDDIPLIEGDPIISGHAASESSPNNNDNNNNKNDTNIRSQGQDTVVYLAPVYTNFLGQDVLLSTWTLVRAVQEATYLGETYVNIRFRAVTETQIAAHCNTQGVRWLRLTAFQH
ncbi:hypothetical protein DFQ26_007540 [Actinomortierella ambigua]|nr:hypothetical protein DFQ26_007540 [Actinomortierella ambigua]